jgi:hypothetical protein
MLGHEALQLGDDLGVLTASEVGVDASLAHDEPELVEARCDRPYALLPGKV